MQTMLERNAFRSILPIPSLYLEDLEDTFAVMTTDLQDSPMTSRCPENHPAEQLYAGLKTARQAEKTRSKFFQEAIYHLTRLFKERLVLAFDQGGNNTLSADLRGGKGFGLAQLVRLGMPVPAGATITTVLSRTFAQGQKLPTGLACELARAIEKLELQTGLGFGDPERPLLISVRSGAPVSMPGMMDTVLNVGLSRSTIDGLASRADKRFACDSYRRFLAMFGSTVLGIDRRPFEEALSAAKYAAGAECDSDLSVKSLLALCDTYEKIIERVSGRAVPADPLEQLALSIIAVLDSWGSQRAQAYRAKEGISSSLGTAVNIQAMVFGNKGKSSGTGVVFSANPQSGEKGMFGEYLENAQGEDVVSGVRTPQPVSALALLLPDAYEQLVRHVAALERHYRDMVDVEFTVEDGKLYLLQVRPAKRSLGARMVFAVNQVESGEWIPEEAIASVGDIKIAARGETYFQEEALRQAAEGQSIKGVAASSGAATGKLYFTIEGAIAASERGEDVILARMDTSPTDLPGMLRSRAIITACGGFTSHAAVVARGMHIPAVVGCRFAIENGQLFNHERTLILTEGAPVSVDGHGGLFVAGIVLLRSDQSNRVVDKLRQYHLNTELRLEDNTLDLSLAKTCWNMNQLLNDFYLLNSMSAKIADDKFGREVRSTLEKNEIQLAQILTCYFAFAVCSELRYLKQQARLADPHTLELISRGIMALADVDSEKAAQSLAQYDSMYQEQFFRLSAGAFSHKSWSGSFGGPKWAAIAQAPAEYLGGNLPTSIFIDHSFDLRHNGGILFNKHDMVSRETNERALQIQLDIKKACSDVDELYAKLLAISNKLSPEVQQIYDRGAEAGHWRGREITGEVACQNEQSVLRSHCCGATEWEEI